MTRTAAPAPLDAVAEPAGPSAAGRTARPPSWWRALLLSLLVLAAGAALGAGAYHLERSVSTEPPAIERTADGWRISSHHRREVTGLALSGDRLFWQNGAAIEYLDLTSGDLRLLGPGPGMRTTWDPAADGRYAVWFEAERTSSVAAQAVVYDTRTGRRRTLTEVGAVRSYAAISGDIALWCSAPAFGSPSINGARIGSGEAFTVSPGDGAPVVSEGLVVWATTRTGPFRAAELASGAIWPVTAGLSDGRLTGMALAGRILVWGQSSEADGSGVVAAVDVDGGDTRTLASGLSGLAGPAFDGRTVVWAERVGDAPAVLKPSDPYAGFRVMGRRLGGPAFLIAEVADPVSEVAVSGDLVAWISSWSGDDHRIDVARLPR